MHRPPKAKTADKHSTGSFTLLQSFIHGIHRSLGEGEHLAPQGMAGFVLANGSMYSNQSGDWKWQARTHNPISVIGMTA